MTPLLCASGVQIAYVAFSVVVVAAVAGYAIWGKRFAPKEQDKT